jgi:predicted DNA-binding transcriptional regulator YafY
MADNGKLFARFTMMNYLQASPNGRTVQEILDHVSANTEWGKTQQGRDAPRDRGLRNVQNWLKDIRESDEFGRRIDWHEDPDDRRQFRYSSLLPTIGKRIMPPEEACMLLLAEKFLDAALPADFYEQSLHDLFVEARESLKNYERRPKRNRWRVGDYLKRITITQRGQALVEHLVPYKVLGVIMRAMLEGKCVDMRYRDRRRSVHPYGIVIKSPKIYFLAVDYQALFERHPGKLIPRQFLCARIEEAAVSDLNNHVPDAFSADAFIEKEGLDVALQGEGGEWERAFTLKLRIFAGGSDNLLQDLREFPLAKGQVIEAESGTDNYLLKAPGMRASHQLTEWVVGRLDRVEVLRPSRFREHVASQLAAASRIYDVI